MVAAAPAESAASTLGPYTDACEALRSLGLTAVALPPCRAVPTLGARVAWAPAIRVNSRTSHLQDNPSWLHGLVDGLPGAVYRGRHDDARSLLYISAGCRRFFGAEPGELTQAPPTGGLARWIDPEDRLLVQEAIRDALARDVSYEVKFRVPLPGGGYRWMLDRGRGVRVEGEPGICVEGVLTDISAGQAAQAQLAACEHVVNAIFERTFHFIGLLDDAGRLLRANRSSLLAVGARAEDVVGRFFWDTPWWSHDPEQQDVLRDAIRRAAAGVSVRLDAELRRPDGSSVYVDFSLSPVHDERGRVVGLIPEGHDITARRSVERALRESEEKLARAFAASPDAITITDLKSGLLIDVNQGFEQLFEWPRDAAIGRSTRELGLWVNERDRIRLVEALMRDGRVREFSAVGRMRSGRLARCAIAGELVDIAGARAIILVIRDITEQVRAEQALREGEERMRLLIENAPDAITVLDLSAGTLVEVNSQAVALFEMSRDQLLGRSILELSPEHQPDGRTSSEAAHQYLMAAMGGGRPVFEWMHRTHSGRDVPCEVRLIRLPSPDAVLIRGSIMDLSERKRAEHAFRALLEGTAGVSGQQFFDNTVARLARELEVPVALVAETEERDGRLLLRCLARSDAGAPEPMCADVHGTILDTVLHHRGLCTEHGLSERFPDDPFVKQLGIDSLMAVPVRDRTGVVLGLVLIADTQRVPDSEAARLLVAVSASRAAVEIQHRRSDEAIHRLNADLERRVDERTAQLAEANAELESFSYSVSHDLRSPLRAIDGFSRALEEDFGPGLTAEARDFLLRIRAASQRMGVLIDDLLRLSRASRVDMHPEQLDLSAIARSILEEMRQREPDRAVQIEIEPDLRVVGDRALVGILLQNLLENAWKYTRRTQIARIEFGRAGARAEAEAPGGPVFKVRDNGAGFDMRYVGKLFAPFQRLHGATEFEGTGIGLATVRRIIVRHGGRVWIEGAVGQGATVFFTFGRRRD